MRNSSFRATAPLIALCSLSALAVACGGNPTVHRGSAGDAGSSGAGPNGGSSGVGGDIQIGGGAQGGDAGAAGAAGGPDRGACGDGTRNVGEQCDDGNVESQDGCNALCQIEAWYDCPPAGGACHSLIVCGDSKLMGNEACDDGNEAALDGCDAHCQPEPGFSCDIPGAPCRSVCGDGLKVGREQCDDGNSTPGDGCDASCKLEWGWKCPTPNEACTPTVCGDGHPEGTEQCDDGNLNSGDGCSPDCRLEPSCRTAQGVYRACTSVCGDGFSLPGDDEECDDGNSLPGDGCSPNCKIEEGWYCDRPTAAGETLTLPIVLRDFIGVGMATHGGVTHPQFQWSGTDEVDVGDVQTTLDADGRPVHVSPAGTAEADAFAQWYKQDPINLTVVEPFTLNHVAGTADTYAFASSLFFPLDGQGWVSETPPAGMTGTWPKEILGEGRDAVPPATCPAGNLACCDPTTQTCGMHNFAFTSVVRYWFEYRGGEKLDFTGDDAVWVFLNGQMVIDLGGTHGPLNGTVTLPKVATNALTCTQASGTSPCTGKSAADLGLALGQVYEIAVFQSERHTYGSNYRLTISGFANTKSQCTTQCGDGFRAGDEICDHGTANVSPGAADAYGACLEDCTLGSWCGDGVVDEGQEACDDPIHAVYYTQDPTGGACKPTCEPASFCGDGKIDSDWGEQCDEGADGNVGGYGGCNPDCTLVGYCGDGVVQKDAGEKCDLGGNNGGTLCDRWCQVPIVK